jgi:hypothetical protein
MKNIFVLPTDKPSRLYEFGGEYHLQIKSQENFRSQHIYITNDEKIKVGDWFYYKHFGEDIISKVSKNTDLVNINIHKEYFKKIILTTDQDLIKDGVQSVDEEFLQWFIKNSDCEKVEVELIDTFKKTNEVYVDEITGGNYYEIIKKYKIIIPKEELKTSHQWQLTYPDPVVMDPDGWDRKNYQYSWFEEKITLAEYNRRMLMSTCVIFTPQEETKPEGYICPHTKLQCDDECCVSTKDCHIKASLGILSEPKDEELSRIASTAPEPGGKDGWVKQFKNK